MYGKKPSQLKKLKEANLEQSTCEQIDKKLDKEQELKRIEDLDYLAMTIVSLPTTENNHVKLVPTCHPQKARTVPRPFKLDPGCLFAETSFDKLDPQDKKHPHIIPSPLILSKP